MATNYPNSLDTFVNPAATDTLDKAGVQHDVQHTNVNDAVKAVQTELGTNPRGSSASVAARLTALASADATQTTATAAAQAAASYPIAFSGSGNAAVGQIGGPIYNDTGVSRKLVKLRASVATAPTGSPLVVQLSKNGTPIGTCSIPDGSTTAFGTITGGAATSALVAGSYAGDGSATINLSRTPLQTSLVVVAFTSWYATATAVSGLGATWARIGSASSSAGSYTQFWLGRFASAPTGTTVVIANGGFSWAHAFEVTGLDLTATPVLSLGSAPNSPTMTADTGDFVIAFAYTDTPTGQGFNNPVPAAGWALQGNSGRGTLAYRVATAAGQAHSVTFVAGTVQGPIGMVLKAIPATLSDGDNLTASVTQVGSTTPGVSPVVQVTAST